MEHSRKLSMHIVTYNQVRFIRQTLDSVLMQRLSDDYEVLIGDDASTDGTAEVLREYQARYPDKIRPTLREQNLGPGPNAVDILGQCSGEYVAFLEGDDYWTDPEKLSLQIAYLDSNPDCSLVHHTVEHVNWPSEESLGEHPAPMFRHNNLRPCLLAMVNYIQTCSVMLRRSALPNLDKGFLSLRIGDWPLFVLLSQKGRIGYIDRVMAHYRIHGNNSWNNRNSDFKIRAMEAMSWYLLERVRPDSRVYWQNTLLALAFKDLALSARALAPAQFAAKLRRFLALSIQFRKPFWIVHSLWPYYRATRRPGPRANGCPAPGRFARKGQRELPSGHQSLTVKSRDQVILPQQDGNCLSGVEHHHVHN
jgi:glycosyltransferase involved in cell wall biosynthesis